MPRLRSEPSIPIDQNGLAADLLYGVCAIAAFISQPERRTVYLLETKRIPAGKLGQRWVASRQVLREHYARLTRGEAR
jgi:hypothetical protein